MTRPSLPLTVLSIAALLIAPARAEQGIPLEPAVGSAERKVILDALRQVGDVPDRVFVVRSMRVQDGWAWVVVDPESRDRSQHYETESALLQKINEGWKVVDRPCEEDGCDPKREVARIRSEHPDVPAALFSE